MKFTTTVTFIVTLVSVCYAVIPTPPADNESGTHQNVAMPTTDPHHPANFDYAPITDPILAYLNATNVAGDASGTQSAIEKLQGMADVDFDDVYLKVFGDGSQDPSVQKRYPPVHIPPCGMETVISAMCRTMHFCRFSCIVGVNPFPFYTCTQWLINGRCPTGQQGMEILRPPPEDEKGGNFVRPP